MSLGVVVTLGTAHVTIVLIHSLHCGITAPEPCSGQEHIWLPHLFPELISRPSGTDRHMHSSICWKTQLSSGLQPVGTLISSISAGAPPVPRCPLLSLIHPARPSHPAPCCGFLLAFFFIFIDRVKPSSSFSPSLCCRWQAQGVLWIY